ncbi:VWA domain-containing protein [Ponticoccus litoralis]|uniref:VWA domain-containing protein n=1 Tax=Ponticoccus litoralis TaxID=422297 RepID=A0AAW9SIQ7_9RHOB
MARKQFISSALRSSALGGIAAIAGNRIRHFAADPSGNMSYVAIAGSLVMLVFGGIGVDMMHAELKRNKVQNTLDRAVLAAANIDNEMDPTFVVGDYFRAMNMADTLSSVEVQQGINSKRVTASGETTISSNFMSLIGVDTLAAAGRARAENAGALMEISLVLDISGSMSGQKIEQLKTAAKSFVDMVLGEGGAESNVTISIVPYNATVNLGDSFSQYFRLEGLHDYSHCAWFNAADFDTTEIDPDATLGQISHFDLYGNGQGAPELSSPWCYTGETAAVVPHSSDPGVLKARIDAFQCPGQHRHRPRDEMGPCPA